MPIASTMTASRREIGLPHDDDHKEEDSGREDGHAAHPGELLAVLLEHDRQAVPRHRVRRQEPERQDDEGEQEGDPDEGGRLV
jgi:hypothetical protein